MKMALLWLCATFSLPTWAGERCIAIDGDTLVCNRQKFRLTNVYAAEMNEPGGAAAKRHLQLLIGGREVEFKRLGHDRYGRVLAEAYVDGRRIEQADIGPRAGRGSGFHGERHEASFPGGSTAVMPRPHSR